MVDHIHAAEYSGQTMLNLNCIVKKTININNNFTGELFNNQINNINLT